MTQTTERKKTGKVPRISVKLAKLLDFLNRGQADPSATPILTVRRDKCGAIIHFDRYGKRESSKGWEIDHIIPVVKCGGDELDNLQPLHWRNNVAKGDDPDILENYCRVVD